MKHPIHPESARTGKTAKHSPRRWILLTFSLALSCCISNLDAKTFALHWSPTGIQSTPQLENNAENQPAILNSFQNGHQPSIDSLFGQRTEIRFQFIATDPAQAEAIGRIVSIDHRKDSLYTAYANRQEMQAFLKAGYRIARRLEPGTGHHESTTGRAAEEKPASKAITMANSVEEMSGWDRYPTYPVYLEMMQTFAARYPGICRLDTIGLSVNQRLILCLKISDQVMQDEAEPEFFYSSSIHGDELTGFILMLRLADHLLKGYGTDTEATRLVDGMQIYINPLANPDGAYAASDLDVSGATRYNARFVDLNRNYPDFWSGTPSGIQQENLAMMDYLSKHDFTMSVNLHGGSDVLNFPWDGFRSSQRRHADYDWWCQVSQRYVDSCRRVDPSAYRDVNAQGYIHGGDWYVVHNGRQDYVNVYHHCREQTLEISVVKTPDAAQLPSFWETNHRSLINYMKEATYGIRGIVTDSLSGEPLRAFIQVEGHDRDSSQIHSSAIHGGYFRPIAAGTYDLRFSAPGYHEKIIENIEVRDFASQIQDVRLSPRSPESLPSDTAANQPLEEFQKQKNIYRLYPNPASQQVHVESKNGFCLKALYRAADGKKVLGFPETRMQTARTLETSNLTDGLYILEIKGMNGETTRLRFVKQ